MSLTDNQKKLLTETWAKLVPIKTEAGKLFYSVLFEANPEVKALFHRDVGEQANMLMDAVNAVVSSLDNLGAVVPVLQELGARHAKYGVKEEHYAVVGAALLQTLEKGLGNLFTSEVKEAWTVAYGIIASVMKDAAKN